MLLHRVLMAINCVFIHVYLPEENDSCYFVFNREKYSELLLLVVCLSGDECGLLSGSDNNNSL